MLSPHFKKREFTCKCCGKLPSEGIDPLLIARLECLRTYFKRPIIITSGYRCEKHNARIGGARGSLHREGKAADIKIPGISPRTVWVKCKECFADGGVGSYGTHTHVDTRGYCARW